VERGADQRVVHPAVRPHGVAAELDAGDDTEDGDGVLVVLGWLDLGTEPQEVAAVLRAYRTGPLR